jgi:Family of unknown function (DUF5519)
MAIGGNRLTEACRPAPEAVYYGGVSVDSGGLWDAVVDVMLAAGHVREGRSRYGDKPALFAGSREIAHLEQDGAIDLRITRAGWARARQDFAADPAVLHDPDDGTGSSCTPTTHPTLTGSSRSWPSPRQLTRDHTPTSQPSDVTLTGGPDRQIYPLQRKRRHSILCSQITRFCVA